MAIEVEICRGASLPTGIRPSTKVRKGGSVTLNVYSSGCVEDDTALASTPSTDAVAILGCSQNTCPD